jgi:hypothetical protein
VKSDKDRGEFGAWLRRQRIAQFPSVAAAIAAMKRRKGYSLTQSEWAELEAGTRRPSAERRAALEDFLGVAPPEPVVDPMSEEFVTQRVEVIAALTEAIKEQTQVFRTMLQMMHDDQAQSMSPEGLKMFLRTLHAEGLLVAPDIPTSPVEPDPPMPALPLTPRDQVRAPR